MKFWGMEHLANTGKQPSVPNLCLGERASFTGVNDKMSLVNSDQKPQMANGFDWYDGVDDFSLVGQ